MLALLFSCCGLRHRPHDQPNEHTPLIPHADDTPTSQPRVVDQQKFKERLGSVVRSKEGKMVNVNAPFPFNLHDQQSQEHSSSQSSCDVSGGTLSNSRPPSPPPLRHLHKSPSTASLPDGPPLVVGPAASILNIRLVKSARSTHSTRGRSQRIGDSISRTPVPISQSELAPDEENTPRAQLPTSPLEQSTHPPDNSETPPCYPEDFNIHDAGAVARSWGD
ncbi:hypothetical protein JVT61DRAFT_3087 [Boletus reticuloceps]|uniref:Uncharacterized protein n=1 Tax=Boletus reticuloceps TaxID=495285 RepID=A0A8I3A9T8_9AGAM|nr:hypothetical protein JVT61DRAFT_3087 [Boletus reticuloceps]